MRSSLQFVFWFCCIWNLILICIDGIDDMFFDMLVGVSEKKLGDLAGNAVHRSVCMASMVAAFAFPEET